MRLLQAIHAQLAGNDDRFIFVSTSNAPELAELATRSRQAESLQEFEEQFLAAQKVKDHLEKLQKHWGNANVATADTLGSIAEPLPDDAVEMLHWLATEHPDSAIENWEEQVTGGQPYHRRDILSHGINTTRGRAAEAIRTLIIADGSHVARSRATIDRLVVDPSLAVRACVASTLLATAHYNAQLALERFLTLVVADDRLLATPYVEQFIYHSLREHFLLLRPLIEWMLRSTNPDVSHTGASLASLAALCHTTAVDLADAAMHGHASQRRGVAEVAAANIARTQCRAWCEPRLLQLFNDNDLEVRRQVAACFRQLTQEPLEAMKLL